MDRSTVVPSTSKDVKRQSSDPQPYGKLGELWRKQGKGTRVTEFDSRALLLNPAMKANLSAEALEFYLESWDEKTLRQYRCYLDKWLMFCEQFNLNPVTTEVREGVDFLINV